MNPIEDPWAVKVDDVARWQFYRRDREPERHGFDAGHNVTHVAKALGPLAGAAEHRDHQEPEGPREEKRAADLIIHAIWLVQALGYDPAKVVAERMAGFADGFHLEESCTLQRCHCNEQEIRHD